MTRMGLYTSKSKFYLSKYCTLLSRGVSTVFIKIDRINLSKNDFRNPYMITRVLNIEIDLPNSFGLVMVLSL